MNTPTRTLCKTAAAAGALLLFVLLFAGTASAEPPAAAAVTLDADNRELFANGYAIVIDGSAISFGDGTVEYTTPDGNPCPAPDNLSGYTVYGGSFGRDLSAGTHLTVLNAPSLTAVYGGGKSGRITGDIILSVDGGNVADITGGSRDGDIDGSIHTVIKNISDFNTVYGGSRGGAAADGNIQKTASVTGNIRLEIYQSSGRAVFGASAVGDVTGDVALYINACPIHDEGENGACGEDCVNYGLRPEYPVRDTIANVYGGGGDIPFNGDSGNAFAGLDAWRDYANVYGNTKVVISGNTDITLDCSGGGRQGNVHGDVTLIAKGNTRFPRNTGNGDGTELVGYWLQAAGYRSSDPFVAENVKLVLGGNLSAGYVFGGGANGSVQNAIEIVVKDHADISRLYAGSLDGGYSDTALSFPGDRGAITVQGNSRINQIFSTVRGGYMDSYAVRVLSGTVTDLYGGGRTNSTLFPGVSPGVKTAVLTVSGGTVNRLAGTGADGATEKAEILVDGGDVASVGATAHPDAGGSSHQSETDSSSIRIGGGTVGAVYAGAGAGCNINRSSELSVFGGTVGSVFGGGYNASTGIKTTVSISGGNVETLYGGARDTAGGALKSLTETAVHLTGGTVGTVYMGGKSEVSSAKTAVARAALTVDGAAITKNIIVAAGYTPFDTLGEPDIRLHRLSAADYRIYLSKNDLAAANRQIQTLGDADAFWVVAETDPAAVRDRLFPYKLHLESVVTFHRNGGVTGANPEQKTVIYPGKTVGALPLPPTRPDYTFSGWNSRSDGGGEAVTSSTRVFGDMTVYAVWQSDLYEVRYDGSGSTGGSVPAATRYKKGVSVIIPAGIPERSGHRFTGWRSDFDQKLYQSGELFTMPQQNVRFTAEWEAERETTVAGYTVRYHGNRNTGGFVPVSALFLSGATVSVPGGAPERTGFRFTGWRSDDDGRLYQPGASFVMPQKNVGFTAEWEALSYTLRYDPNGGGAPPRGADFAYGDTVTVAASPERAGYRFEGWSLENGSLYLPGDTFSMPAYSVTLTAEWKEGRKIVVNVEQTPGGTSGGETAPDSPETGGSPRSPVAANDDPRFAAQSGNVFEDLSGGLVPAANFGGAAWGLLNLIFAGLSLPAAAGAFFAGRHKQNDPKKPRRNLLRALSVFLGLLPANLFLMFENIRKPAALMNSLTPFILAAVIAFALVTALRTRQK